jgi:1,4-alpha-glucan branching enzyme
LTFGMMYAFSENFILPLSHDEVVHGKGSLIGKMPGDRWRQFANLRALYGWMWGHPGKKLLFMGQEFGQDREWSEERQLDWFLLDDQPDEGEPNRHVGLQSLVRDINAAYRANPAMWRRDVDPQGFEWIDANNADAQLLSFIRRGDDGDPDVAVIANLSALPLHNVRFGLSVPGSWEEILNTDAAVYGGSNVGNMGAVEATDQPCHGLPASGHVTCPPLGVVWLRAPS